MTYVHEQEVVDVAKVTAELVEFDHAEAIAENEAVDAYIAHEYGEQQCFYCGDTYTGEHCQTCDHEPIIPPSQEIDFLP